ncbi:putative ribonuclease H-like domain-containing protein, partial [Tanacetum coccineum]
MDDFCREKGIKREYSVARTPQQNGMAEGRYQTLIEAAKTMLADSKLLSHFGINNNLGKFDGKSDEGFFVGYSLSSKAFRVYNTRTRRVEENLHIGSYWFQYQRSAGHKEKLNTCTIYSERRNQSRFAVSMPFGKMLHTLIHLLKMLVMVNQKLAVDDQNQVFRNKKDERGIVIRNKARLVAQGHRQEEDAFLYGTIEEEVYVTQPPGFKDPDHPDKVYKVVKALYGLHQAPRAWYETLANYLLGNGFKRGKIDQTLFIKKQKGDILLVHVYVDDIIFGSTNKELSEILKKFNYTDVKSVSTPIDLEKHLVKDGDADDVE